MCVGLRASFYSGGWRKEFVWPTTLTRNWTSSAALAMTPPSFPVLRLAECAGLVPHVHLLPMPLTIPDAVLQDVEASTADAKVHSASASASALLELSVARSMESAVETPDEEADVDKAKQRQSKKKSKKTKTKTKMTTTTKSKKSRPLQDCVKKDAVTKKAVVAATRQSLKRRCKDADADADADVCATTPSSSDRCKQQIHRLKLQLQIQELQLQLAESTPES